MSCHVKFVLYSLCTYILHSFALTNNQCTFVFVMSQMSAITSNPNMCASIILIDNAGVQSVPSQTWKGSFVPCWEQESFQYCQKSNVGEYYSTARNYCMTRKQTCTNIVHNILAIIVLFKYMGVSPKWMVYNGKPY